MNSIYERDLDLNLLRVFVVVAEVGSVTAAASRLYLTQPAVSAALGRLARSLGTPLFTRSGRRLVLTARGERLLSTARPHLEALVDAALAPEGFDPRHSQRTIRLGLSDAAEGWLLPVLLRALAHEAPLIQFVVLPVQFRTVAGLLASGAVDVAVTVPDALPAGIRRQPLFVQDFLCVFDPAVVRLPKKLTLERYLAQDHIVVSYNGDLRGVVEDVLGFERRVRVSLPNFHSVGAVIDGTALVATLPALVAHHVVASHSSLRTSALPFRLGGVPMELLWRDSTADDEALCFVRGHIVRLAAELTRKAHLRRPDAEE